MPKKIKKIAIITGASSGIGWEFALQVDKNLQLDEIWLVARRLTRLRKLSKLLTNATPVPVRADLSTEVGVTTLVRKMKKEKPEISLFINNAGIGKMGKFEVMAKKGQLSMIDLNIRALTELTWEAVPFMKPGSAFIQVASLVGFIPMPYFSVYSATKAFVLSFSSTLASELKEKGIHSMALCPGPVRTEFTETASGVVDSQLKGAIEAYDVVAAALRHLRRKKWFSVAKTSWKIMIFIPRLLSRKLVASLMKEQVKKMHV